MKIMGGDGSGPAVAHDLGMLSMITLTVNGKTHTLDVEPDTPLLWVLRDHLDLTGTKFGCGIAQCGACTRPPRWSPKELRHPRKRGRGQAITTIEGLAGDTLHAVQQAWIERAPVRLLPIRPAHGGGAPCR